MVLICRQCALIRKTLEEVFQDFQDSSKSSNDRTNFVDQEPFIVKQGLGVNSSQSPPQINHNCCYECGDSLDDIFCQRCTSIQKKEEEKRIAEEQAAKDRYWKIPICYDDDEDYTIAITPVLPTKEPVNSLSMGDEHLDTIPATESDKVIKSSVENLVPIPTFNRTFETIIDSNDDSTSSDDDSYENIDYVDASPPDAEIVSLEVVEIVIPEVGGIDRLFFNNSKMISS
ncbi:hypothetical protein Tco_1091024 [Tanacetum coccineum]|uniref:Uncharacterized protein n=1 Tax=Tanacetum coccineum TaxID=301880 RepID=A0ABQ5I5U6_9ASTR